MDATGCCMSMGAKMKGDGHLYYYSATFYLGKAGSVLCFCNSPFSSAKACYMTRISEGQVDTEASTLTFPSTPACLISFDISDIVLRNSIKQGQPKDFVLEFIAHLN